MKNNVEKQEILGVQFDNLNKDEVLEKIKRFLESKGQHYIVLPYSEFLVRAKRDLGFREILNNADLSIAEGMGPVFASKLLGKPLKGRITGVELIEALCVIPTQDSPASTTQDSPASSAGRTVLGWDWRTFLFGGKNDVADEAAKTLMETGHGVVGMIHGENYQDPKRHQEIIEVINQAKPQILFVALGSPKQEQWIVENLSKVPSVKVAIGVGGAFDFISGRAKRAPKLLQNIGLEWAWRFIRNPRQLPRTINAAIVFPVFVSLELLKKQLNNVGGLTSNIKKKS